MLLKTKKKCFSAKLTACIELSNLGTILSVNNLHATFFGV